jgi:hypothetical protein
MSEKSSIVVPANSEATLIRFPKGILKELGKAAAKSGRSRNSEIVYRLVSSLNQEKQVA